MASSACLLDWDGTLRKGYVIRDWLRFLVEQGVVDKQFKEAMDNHFAEYKKDRLDYEQMAQLVVETYASSLSGKQVTVLDKLTEDFVDSDSELFSFAQPLIDLLLENEIEPIVISGSPVSVVRHFARRIGIQRCYGLELPAGPNGTFLGTVSANLAIAEHKQAIVNQLRAEFLNIPLSLGDSISDVPLLEAAHNAYLMREENVRPEEPGSTLSTAISAGRIHVVSPEGLRQLVANGSILRN